MSDASDAAVGGPLPTPITRIVLVRHGEAECNVAGVFGGEVGCTGLSDRGRRQVAALRDRWQSSGEVESATLLYASVLPRAIETADILRDALPRVAGVAADCDLCELHPGEADGMSFDEYAKRFYKEHSARWPDDPHVPTAPGGESWAGFCERVAARLARLAEDHVGETIVVACHGGVIDASLIELLDMPRRYKWARFQTVNASVTEWSRRGDSWRLVRYNDASHTQGI